MPPTTRASKRSRDANLGCLLAGLGDDHLLLIFACLDARMLNTFCMTSKAFLRVGSEDVLWKALLCAELGDSNVPRQPCERGGWRRRFLQWQRLEYCTLTSALRPTRYVSS